MKLKPFKAWMLYDFTGTYAPSVHTTRTRAVQERDFMDYSDAKWRIVRVNIRPIDSRVAEK